MSSFADNRDALSWLKGHCYLRLTKWEQGFVDDLLDRVENGEVGAFTPKQEEIIDRMWERYVMRPV